MTDHIKAYWDQNASKPGHEASWGDNWCVALEIDNIAQYIKDGDRVLDVGCANGFALIEQAKRHQIYGMGVDFSEEMIANTPQNTSELMFEVGDVKNLPYPDDNFDLTYTTRCLINLPTWEEQVQGIKECIRVTRTGGTIILSEAFYEPLQKLNAIRLIAGLSPLVEHDFNRYLKKEKLEEALEIMGFGKEGFPVSTPRGRNGFVCVDFSSVYYLGSRFLRELVSEREYEGYSNPINEIFYGIEQKFSGGGFGIQQAYIIRK